MLKMMPDGRCERWNDLWSHSYYYDEKCDGCKYIVQIGKRKFCGKCEGGRVILHDVIRSQIGCVFCENYTKKLDSAKCLRCLDEHPDAPPFAMAKICKRGVYKNARD